MTGEIKDRHNLLVGDGGIESQEVIYGFSPFKQVDQTQDGDTGIPKARRAAHLMGIDPDSMVKFLFL